MSEQVIRHPNGGAQKIGLEVHVSADSFCDHLTQIQGNSSVIRSSMCHSWARNVHAFASKLNECSIGDSVIAESGLIRIVARDVVLDQVTAWGDRGSIITLEEVVAENCRLFGRWSLFGNARITCGDWHRAPRFKRITGDNGVDVGLTESTNGHALMACWRKPITQWLKSGPRLGIKHKWSEDQINTARLFYESLLDCPMDM